MIVHHGDVVAIMGRPELRTAIGTVARPPQIFVAHYSAEHDCFEMLPVSFKVLETLRPDKMAVLGEELRQARNAEPLPPAQAKD